LFLDLFGIILFFASFFEAPRFRLPHCDVARFMFGTVGRRTLGLVIAFFFGDDVGYRGTGRLLFVSLSVIIDMWVFVFFRWCDGDQWLWMRCWYTLPF
jgi:hypothetical protein